LIPEWPLRGNFGCWLLVGLGADDLDVFLHR
jgi:hypothetical protein